MGEPVPSGAAPWVAEIWSAKLAGAIEAMTGDLPQAASKPAAGEAPSGTLWWQHPLSLSPQSTVWIGAPEPSWLAIGTNLLTSAGIEASEPADARNTFLEISSQAVSGFCQASSERLHTNVSTEGGKESPPEAGASLFEVAVKLGADTLPLYVSVSSGLAQALEGAGASAGAASGDSNENAAPRQEREPGRRKSETNPLDLVMDVELPVSVSFGRAELPLRDVLKLTTGSIVELNRGLTDPVEIIVNNCVVARGEVVVIDGNYGVRIQEIVSRDKRMGTMR
jgi:flagellar motor switch protein FliN/FliY